MADCNETRTEDTATATGQAPSMGLAESGNGASAGAVLPKLRVWWMPQIPHDTFHYDVPTVAAGFMLCDALAKYDLWQFENNIKPDYSNAGGLHWLHASGDWIDIDEDDPGSIEEYEEAIAKATGSPS